MCEEEPLLWTPPLPSNGRKTSKCGGILTKKQSAALTLEARIMNFLVLNPQVIPHRTGPSRQVLLGSRLPMSAYRLVCVCQSPTGHNSKPIIMKLYQVVEVVSNEKPIDFEVKGHLEIKFLKSSFFIQLT